MAAARHDPENLLADLVRGACGGCMFALPLIYTMEMWWLGYALPVGSAVLYLLLAGVFAGALNALSGYRESHGWSDVGDAVVALAMGLVVSAVMLVSLGEITPDTSRLVALRQCMVLAIPVSVGVSLSRAQLGGEPDDPEVGGHPLLHRLGIAFAGAVLLGMSAAPTEEIVLVASRVSWIHLLGMSALTAALTWGTVFVAGFPRQGRRLAGGSGWRETVVLHGIGLSVSAVLLLAFGNLRGERSFDEILTTVITLGVPTTLGAAIGRLVL